MENTKQMPSDNFMRALLGDTFMTNRVHVTLSGRNAEPLAIRAVYADGKQIGIVRQSREDGLWIADDMAGHCHGVTYTTDWNAAKQLALSLGMRPQGA